MISDIHFYMDRFRYARGVLVYGYHTIHKSEAKALIIDGKLTNQGNVVLF
jgi:hypothetical protein